MNSSILQMSKWRLKRSQLTCSGPHGGKQQALPAKSRPLDTVWPGFSGSREFLKVGVSQGWVGISVDVSCSPKCLSLTQLPPVFSPQAKSPSPAPTAAAPSLTAPTCGPISRPTRMSKSTSARHAPEPSPECPCSTSTKSQAAQGGPADSKGSLHLSGPYPNSRRKDPASFSLPQSSLLSSAFWLRWPPRTLRTISQSSALSASPGSEGGLSLDS